MLICQDMFLLLTRDNGTQEELLSDNEAALRASVLTELLLDESIVVTHDKQVVAAAKKPEHPVLAWCWEALQEHEPTKLHELLQLEATEWFSPREIIALDFHARGQLEIKEAAWWQLGGDRYVMTDLSPEKALRDRLVDVIKELRAASIHDVVLLDILKEVQGAHSLLKKDVGDMGRREVRDRIEQLAKEVGYNKAVSSSIHDVDEDAGALLAALTALVLGCA